MKKLKSQHYLLLILSILAVLVAVAAYIFMYKDAIKKAEAESILESDVSAASKQTVDNKNMSATYESTAASRALLPEFLVSSDDAVPFIDAVEDVGQTTGAKVSISTLSSSATSGSSNQTITATISVTGTWANVMRAVEMIENMPYAVSVKSISIDVLSSTDQSGSVPGWTAVLSISALSS